MTRTVSSNEPRRELQLRYPGWRVLAAAFFGVLTGYSALVPYTFSMFLKPLSATFGWRRDNISIAFGCVAITIAMCAPVAGRLLDRYGPRRIILPCIAIFASAFGSLSLLTPNIWQFYFVFVLLGLVGNGTTPLAYSRAVSAWFVRRRGLALAWVSAGAGVGAMTLPLLTGLLLYRYGWRLTYAVLGLLVLCVAYPLAWLFVRETEQERGLNKRESLEKGAVGPAVRSTPFLLLIIAVLLYSVSFNGIASHLSALLTDRGFSLQTSAEALSILGAGGLVGRVFMGFILDRISVTRVSSFLFATTALGVIFLNQRSASIVFLGLAVMGFSGGCEADITPYLLSGYFGLRGFSTLYGLAWTAFATGGAVGTVLMGKMYAVTGSYRPNGVLLFAIPTALSALLMAVMPKYPPLEDNYRTPDQYEVEVPA